MVIVNFCAGQLANRLFHFSHFIANSKAYNYKLIYPYFAEYQDFFEKIETEGDIRIAFFKHSFLNRIFLKTVNSIYRKSMRGGRIPGLFKVHNIHEYEQRDENFYMDDPNFVQSAKTGVLIASGWLYRDPQSYKTYSQDIRRIFTPKKQFLDEAGRIAAACKEEADIIVGVHIRRGDYKEYEGGRWFYPDSVYYDYMCKLNMLFREQNKRCIFLITSNEKVNVSSFPDLKVRWEKRHFITDLYTLSMCDYIIGPPSTFSMWASFYGSVPLFHLKMKDMPLELEGFESVQW